MGQLCSSLKSLCLDVKLRIFHGLAQTALFAIDTFLFPFCINQYPKFPCKPLVLCIRKRCCFYDKRAVVVCSLEYSAIPFIVLVHRAKEY